MHVASLVATRFSIATTLQRSCIMAAHLAQAYGMSGFCREIRAVDLAVLDLEDPSSESTTRITQARAVEQDGCGVIVLGCAGMADLAGLISRQLGVPVVEGVYAGVKPIETLVGLARRTRKRGDLDYPPANPTRVICPVWLPSHEAPSVERVPLSDIDDVRFKEASHALSGWRCSKRMLFTGSI